MRCTRTKGQLGAYLYGDLNPARKKRVENHLTKCRRCASEAERLREVMTALPEQPVVFPSPGEWENIGRRVLAQALAGERIIAGRRPSPAAWMSQWVLAPAFAALSLVLALMLYSAKTPVIPAGEDLTVRPLGEMAGEMPDEGLDALAFYAAVERDESSAEELFEDIERLERDLRETIEGSVNGGGITWNGGVTMEMG